MLGFLESDRKTVRGGVFFEGGANGGRGPVSHGPRCVIRTSAERIIVVADGSRCKWCEGSAGKVAPREDFERVAARTYLRSVFNLPPGKASRLAELLSELTRARSERGESVSVFAGPPPYCTVPDVRHISSVALELLFEFDRDFVWGDNLIFSTEAEISSSLSTHTSERSSPTIPRP